MSITKDIFYVGVNDHQIDLFEGQYTVPHGMAYNSYVILDEKIAVMDAVDQHFGDAWLEKVEQVLQGRTPDYLVVHHMEPDHSANVARFLETYPAAQVVASARAFPMLKSFFGKEYEDRRLIVKEGDTLPLGRHTLHFVLAPMVHWPEVMMSYDDADKVLFSADAFGKFGALDVEEDWACEARRYYFGIVGKYGAQVQQVLKKAAGLDIRIICALHGPVLTQPLDEYFRLYDLWSRWEAEEEGVVIACTSVYGHTMQAAQMLLDELKALGCKKVVLNDLARCDMHEAVEDAFRYDKLVLCTTTYNGDIFPFMRSFLHHLTERGFQGRKIGLVENGSWAPMAARIMKGMLENSKNLSFADTTVRILSALNDESRAQVRQLARELMA